MSIEIPLHFIRMGPNIPGGMETETLISLVYSLRWSIKDIDPPVEVFKESDTCFHLHDGRHRFLASFIAGRSSIRATVLGPWPGVEHWHDLRSRGRV